MDTNLNTKVLIGTCPGCDAKIRFHNRLNLGEFVTCEECGDELEIVQLTPLKLDWAYADPLDDDDYNYDDDFDADDKYYDWDDDEEYD